MMTMSINTNRLGFCLAQATPFLKMGFIDEPIVFMDVTTFVDNNLNFDVSIIASKYFLLNG